MHDFGRGRTIVEFFLVLIKRLLGFTFLLVVFGYVNTLLMCKYKLVSLEILMKSKHHNGHPGTCYKNNIPISKLIEHLTLNSVGLSEHNSLLGKRELSFSSFLLKRLSRLFVCLICYLISSSSILFITNIFI